MKMLQTKVVLLIILYRTDTIIIKCGEVTKEYIYIAAAMGWVCYTTRVGYLSEWVQRYYTCMLVRLSTVTQINT